MNILIVAPFHPDLPNIPDEAAGLRNAIDGRLVQGTVTEKDIIAAINDGPYDGIWFATHGDASGVWLSNGERLDAHALTQYIAAAGASWIFLNSCESMALVDTIRAATRADVIATSSRVPDVTAWRTARLFALALASTGNVRKALARAAPDGANVYRFWENRPTGMGVTDVSDSQLKARLSRLEARMEQIERTSAARQEMLVRLERLVDRLWNAIFGDDDSLQIGLLRWFRWGSIGTAFNTLLLAIIAWHIFFGG